MCVLEDCWNLKYIMWQCMQNQATEIRSFRAVRHMKEVGYYSPEHRELLKFKQK